MEELINWYLAPWRRLSRAPFNTIVAVVAVPGILLWILGFGEHLGGIGGLLTGVADAGQQMQHAPTDTADMTNMVNTLLTPPAAEDGGIDWGNVGGWVDSILWLLCLPLVRMRVRDLGYGNGSVTHWVWVVAAFGGTLFDLLTKLGVPGLESIATVASVISFVALLVLCLKHAPVAERDAYEAGPSPAALPRDPPHDRAPL